MTNIIPAYIDPAMQIWGWHDIPYIYIFLQNSNKVSQGSVSTEHVLFQQLTIWIA